MTADQTSPTTTLTARTPEDVLAVVPVVLGFEPTESMVMLTFGSDPPFHARVDLPEDACDLAEMAAMLAAPAGEHRAPLAFLVAYSERDRFADRAVEATARALRRAGVEVIDALRTDGSRWWPVPSRPGLPLDGTPYDLSAHPFAAQAVYDGRVVHASRDRLAETIAPDPVLVGRVVPALAALTGDPPPALDEGTWVRDLVVGHVASRTVPSDDEVARLLRGMLDVRVRDAAWSPLRRDLAREHVELWTDVVRRAPDPLVPAPAALLAFASWQAGQGALAWCAVDRCIEVDPGYSLAGLVAELLTRAVPPDTWEGEFDWTVGLGR
ncbi:hypothetical protein ASC77_02830 [Nocardioides sp. Root1257]|uniref:DUF4192 domain-containing protein n=1 Tax=unclassified Nocardioides TaxID=2615069 RepID=UPI0006FDB574|nr:MULTISPECIES: DUF4192 domain-containing protein [unclassified Nocardioides]KQW53245.1 hypothetical protein ASC77_02830 [Nocardioides sp. Root1257]KRC55931.1 hypothetical protein ASE24_02830 [Nocardioides sp. Root224]